MSYANGLCDEIPASQDLDPKGGSKIKRGLKIKSIHIVEVRIDMCSGHSQHVPGTKMGCKTIARLRFPQTCSFLKTALVMRMCRTCLMR